MLKKELIAGIDGNLLPLEHQQRTSITRRIEGNSTGNSSHYKYHIAPSLQRHLTTNLHLDMHCVKCVISYHYVAT